MSNNAMGTVLAVGLGLLALWLVVSKIPANPLSIPTMGASS